MPPISRRVLLGVGSVLFISVSAQAGLPVVATQSTPRSRKQLGRPQTGPLPTGRPSALPLVILDPGHGGRDPGAVGYSGTYEKHVALAAALELQHQLQGTQRYRVALTRGADLFIPLDERVRIAQAQGAALFVSLHADALADPAVRGASVYTLSETASDAQTAALAQRENEADRFSGSALPPVSPEIARILTSLVRRETRIGSAHLQRSMVGELGHDAGLLQHPARHAAFAVLKAPDIPSILVEMGFMSNREDEAALRTPAHRARVAVAMRRAIEGFFAQESNLGGAIGPRLAG